MRIYMILHLYEFSSSFSGRTPKLQVNKPEMPEPGGKNSQKRMLFCDPNNEMEKELLSSDSW